MAADEPTRPSPEALLEASKQAARGKLRIFLGAAPGVGKTCAMLKAAHRKRAEGVDVVVALVESHGRRDTENLIEGLDVLPRRALAAQGHAYAEMDLDALLARHPQLALVDELAHSNVDGARHPKRHQDVAELLAAGIDVWSTLNIQHLESLNDVVARITGVRVRETVPDRVFDTADEVEIVDLTPQELIERLNDGKVYAEAQAQAALKNWFKPGNLTALRELALRRTAERVDDQMRAYMRSHAIRGPWAAAERLLVCVNESPASAEVVRRAKRVADRLNAPWFAIHVESARSRALGEKAQTRIADTLRLAESLGAETLSLPGSRDIAADLLAWSRDNNITQILLGKSRRSRWFAFRHGSVVQTLMRDAAGIDLHVLAEDHPPPAADAAAAETPAAPRRSATASVAAYFATAVMVAVATLIGRLLVAAVTVPNISLIYLAAVLWSATRYGLRPSIFASLASTLAYNFFFTEPHYTFNVADPGQVLALIFFCAAAVLTSTLTARERVHAQAAHDQARTTAELLAFSRKLAGIRKLDTLMAASAAQIANMLKVDALMLLPDAKSGALVPMASAPAGAALDEADLAAATWCWEKNQPTGSGTDTLPGGRRLFLPLRTGQGRLGVVGVSRSHGNPRLNPGERRLLDALADLAAIATERIRLAKDIDQARMLAETEKLRGSLLTSISHDLRTPLASIIGTFATLRSHGGRFDAAASEELLASAQEEAERLNRYVANLLDMTRLDAGALEPKRQPCDLGEMIAAAVRRTGKRLEAHKVRLGVPANLPLLLLDETLMDQVLVNLLDNAAKYTPAGSTIEIGVVRHRFSIAIHVRDDGPGIPPGDLDRIFDKFYRVREEADRSRAGTGLGLAICRGFVIAMGGRIHARNRSTSGDGGPGHGAEFLIEFSPELIDDAVPETPA